MMTMTAMPPDVAGTVTKWIEEQAGERNVEVTVYPTGITAHGAWLHVPVGIESEVGDAYDRAKLLQEIEDVWNDDPLLSSILLLLVPASRKGISRQEREEQVGSLIERQRQLLDRMGANGIPGTEAERFAAIRQEWAETLDEMTRLFPALTQ